jgi:hypothetical protein
MHSAVTSHFTIASSRLDAAYLAMRFPWRVIEAVAPHGQLDYHITEFDLGIGEHDRVDRHLVAAKAVLLAHEPALDSLHHDCNYTLWIGYLFPAKNAAFDISSSLSAAFGLLRVDLMIQLAPLGA